MSISFKVSKLSRYRLAQPKLEQQMLKSLRDYGPLSPVVVCQLDGQTVLVDGFKRLRAARTLKGQGELVARFLETDERGAKAAIFNINRITGRPVELKEAWIIYSPKHHLAALARLLQSVFAQLLVP